MTNEGVGLRKELAKTPLVGPEVFELVTNAMYDQPLSMYREYIQNAADILRSTSAGKIDVDIDPALRAVTIRDNGPGLSHEDACRALIPIGSSAKTRDRNVGFRGVGRLAGLAFAESVSFLTRRQGDSLATIVEWNGVEVRQRLRKTGRVEGAIGDCVTAKKVVADAHPAEFFEVRITGIHRFAAGTILDADAVKSYISEVCPVPIRPTFPFYSDVEVLFEDLGRPTMVTISVGDDENPIFRPFDTDIRFSANRTDQYRDLEVIRVPSLDRGSGLAAIGWIAHTDYLGAIPKGAGIRGVRARVGNIQIGGETVFDHLFPQARFNRWCIGEVHVVDPHVVPNGRRDYFEVGPHTRNLENHLGALCRSIVTRCRRSSRKRNGMRRMVTKLSQLEASHSLAASGYLGEEDAQRLVANAGQAVEDLRKESRRLDAEGCLGPRIDGLAQMLRDFGPHGEGGVLNGLPALELGVYQEVFGAIASVAKTGEEAMGTIQAIVERLRADQKGRSTVATPRGSNDPRIAGDKMRARRSSNHEGGTTSSVIRRDEGSLK